MQRLLIERAGRERVSTCKAIRAGHNAVAPENVQTSMVMFMLLMWGDGDRTLVIETCGARAVLRKFSSVQLLLMCSCTNSYDSFSVCVHPTWTHVKGHGWWLPPNHQNTPTVPPKRTGPPNSGWLPPKSKNQVKKRTSQRPRPSHTRPSRDGQLGSPDRPGRPGRETPRSHCTPRPPRLCCCATTRPN